MYVFIPNNFACFRTRHSLCRDQCCLSRTPVMMTTSLTWENGTLFPGTMCRYMHEYFVLVLKFDVYWTESVKKVFFRYEHNMAMAVLPYLYMWINENS